MRALGRNERWKKIESGGKNIRKMTGGGMRSQIEAERESRVGVVASPLDCY